MAQRSNEATLEGAQIRARNFSGKEGTFNPAGQRNFLCLLDDDTAEEMKKDAWPVKYLNPKEDDPEQHMQAFVKVKINMQGEPKPRIVVVTSRNKTTLGAEDLIMLDWADVVASDLVLSQYHYDYKGNTGVTVYLRAGYFTVNESELDLKYAEIPDSAQTSLGREGVHFEDED